MSILINIWLIFVIMPLQNNLKIQQWEKLNKVYTTIYNRYEIWKNFNWLTICDKFIKNWCLDWSLNWINNIYFHFKLNNINEYWSWITYNFFWNYDKKFSINKNNPEFWVITPYWVEIYSKNDMVFLPQELQKKFYDLENKHEILIDWIRY